MRSRSWAAVGLVASLSVLPSCGMMAGMMGQGDKWGAMMEMDAVMDDQGMDMNKIMAKRAEAEAAAVARGSELFNDASIGSSGKSCNSCHTNGGSSGGSATVAGGSRSYVIPSLKGAAAAYPKFDQATGSVATLQMRNNNCISLYMDGGVLDLESWDSFALAHYVTTFSNGETVQGVNR